MKAIKVFLIFVIAIFLSSLIQVFAQSSDEELFKAMESQVLKLVNEHRKSIGLSELQYNESIQVEALNHSKNMAKGIVPFSHNGFEDRADRIMDKIGGNAIAENIANGQSNAESAVESWLSSSGHKQNIEGNYTLSGIGIARGKDGELYFTQIFLLKNPLKK